jgi:N-acetylmuramic acid 6-phosphate (MurNAc-6-P) etherase
VAVLVPKNFGRHGHQYDLELTMIVAQLDKRGRLIYVQAGEKLPKTIMSSSIHADTAEDPV